VLLSFLLGSAMVATAREPVDEVNPFIGAGRLEGTYINAFHGKNFPGAATPMSHTIVHSSQH